MLSTTPRIFKQLLATVSSGGLLIGAEGGVLFSQDSYQKTTVQVTNVKVEIKVLFFKIKKSWTITDVDQEMFHSLRITTFNTMEGTFENLNPGMPAGGKPVWESARFGIEVVDDLAERAEAKFQEILKEAKGSAVMDRLLKAGLVLEVVLVPYASLGEYVETVELAKVGKRATSLIALEE